MGSRAGREAREEGRDRVAAGHHEGAAIRAVLRLVPQEPRAAAEATPSEHVEAKSLWEEVSFY